LTPAPSFRHQLACSILADLLLQYARRIGGRSVQSPVDVELGERTVIQPDVVLVTPSRLDRFRRHLVGAPDLAVEVLSPGTAGRDRREKLALYAASDLRELWLVDPEARTFEALTRSGATFAVALPTGERYASPIFPALEVDLAGLWRELDAPPAV
jgi:Uma2 family endonuclease